jgi:hypothetical protein
MKKTLIAIAFVCSLSSFATEPTVNEKVLDAFNKTFVNVQEVSWSSAAHSYEVNFKLNDVLTRVTYDKEGNTVKTLRYYGEAGLPIVVLTKVKSAFAGAKIFGVTELTVGDETTYHVVLEDDKNWLTVKATPSGQLEKGKTMRKA